MIKILVTGGAGYIGAHTCKALAAAGFAPVTYDNLIYGHQKAVKWGPLERGDLLDTDRLTEVIRAYEPAGVIHFAGFGYVGESVTDPSKYYQNNVVGSLSLLDVMLSHNVKHIVFSSSCATYGIPAHVPIREDALQNPINPYGASKLMIERILGDYRAAYGLKSVALRYFNAAGADPDGEVGEDHVPETHLIPLVLDVAAGRRPNVTIMGEDYGTPDGTCIRDYIHVADLADGHVQALKKLADSTLRPAYNLGTGVGVSVREVITIARSITGHKIPVVRGSRRAGDPPSLIADPARAQEDLGWNPRHSNIHSIIDTAWQWHRRAFHSAG